MSDEAIENLKTCQQQLDCDGTMVGVSRQALEEVLDTIATLQARIAELEEDLNTELAMKAVYIAADLKYKTCTVCDNPTAFQCYGGRAHTPKGSE